MRIKKLTLLLLSFVALNGCIESTALLGPAISVGTSGNVYQASLSYASNQILYNTTGKTTIEHVTSFLDPQNEFEGDLDLILKDNIKDAKKILNKPKEVLKKPKEILKKPQEKLSLTKNKKSDPILNSNLEDQFILF